MSFSSLYLLLRAASLAAIALAVSASAPAQVASPRGTWQFGPYAEAVLDVSTASFTALPGVPNCLGLLSDAAFTSGSGWGFAVGGVAGVARFGNDGVLLRLGGEVRLGFARAETTFQTEERIGSASDARGAIVPIVARYTVKTRRDMIRLEPRVRYRLGEGSPLLLLAGADIGYLFGGSYRQREGIASPGNATYADGSRERNVNEGDLQEVRSMQMGITAGIAGEIALSQGLLVRPELAGSLAFLSPVAGTGWHPHELRMGISVLYTPQREGSSPLQQGE